MRTQVSVKNRILERDLRGESIRSCLYPWGNVQGRRKDKLTIEEEGREGALLFDQKELNRSINKRLQNKLLNREWSFQHGWIGRRQVRTALVPNEKDRLVLCVQGRNLGEGKPSV